MDTQKPEIVNKRRQGWNLKKTLKAHEDRRRELLRKQVWHHALYESISMIVMLIRDQETDGQDVPQLLRSTRDVLRELPWEEEEDIDTNEALGNEVDELAQTAESELQGKQRSSHPRIHQILMIPFSPRQGD